MTRMARQIFLREVRRVGMNRSRECIVYPDGSWAVRKSFVQELRFHNYKI